MIVAMKKATVLSRRGQKRDALHKLRQLGLLHLSAVPAQVAPAQEWREKKALLEKALAVIVPEKKGLHKSAPSSAAGTAKAVDPDAALNAARSILDKQEAIRVLGEESEELKKEALRLHDWQGVSLSDLRGIQGQGYEVMFFEVPPKQLGRIFREHKAFVIRRSKALLWVALVGKKGVAVQLEFKPLEPPRRGAAELKKLQSENQSDLQKFRLELDALREEAGHLADAVHAAAREVELAEAAAAMGDTEALTYLAGFLPADKVQSLRASCRDNSWALLLQDPAADDNVPTIVRNNRWVDFIQPVFQLLGTIPGYREFDISFIFLLFFTFFFAAIIGDAGYGLIVFSGSLFLRSRWQRREKTPPAFLSLMLILSFATIVWGALTGTWFGSEKLAALPWLSWMIVPALSSFNPRSAETFKIIFFTVGAVHISIAHFWSFLRQAREKPFIRSLAQLGWLIMVLGLYYLVLNLVISSEKFPVPVHAKWMIGCGLAAVIAFSRQEGRFLRGVAMGAANLLTTFLSSISAFADIISYIRLFAVGLAGIEISRSFNAIAAGLGVNPIGFLLGGLILLFGHSLNMAMGALSVVVHGVRLNMLEFSGHLGMEWSGTSYKPFKE
jgi:V/A-type H+/Na+-transporting ATPase subunit I